MSCPGTKTPCVRGGDQLCSLNSHASAPGRCSQCVRQWSGNQYDDPFPTGVTLPTGNSLGLGSALGQNISFSDPNHVQPRSTQHTLSVQQQFAGNLALQIAYVGARPTRLEVNHNINVLPAQYYDQGSAEVTYLNNKMANPHGRQDSQ